jgi:hypothetical protein
MHFAQNGFHVSLCIKTNLTHPVYNNAAAQGYTLSLFTALILFSLAVSLFVIKWKLVKKQNGHVGKRAGCSHARIDATGFSGPLLTIENTSGSGLEGAVSRSK